MLGYFTAGIMLCLSSEDPSFETCTVYRSPVAFPTEQMCHSAVIDQIEVLPFYFDMEIYQIIDIKCINWLEELDGIAL